MTGVVHHDCDVLVVGSGTVMYQASRNAPASAWPASLRCPIQSEKPSQAMWMSGPAPTSGCRLR